MGLYALAHAALHATIAAAQPQPFDLGRAHAPSLVTLAAVTPAARWRYAEPRLDLPAAPDPAIRIKWKLRKVKLTMRLPSL